MERVNRRENDCPNAENLNKGYLPWNIQSRRLAEEGIFTFSLEYILEKTIDGGLFMAFVSIYTVGRLNHPYDHPASREFFQVGNEVYRQATKSGLIEAFSPEGVPFPEESVKGTGISCSFTNSMEKPSIIISLYLFKTAYASIKR